jgi:hypothetical protein
MSMNRFVIHEEAFGFPQGNERRLLEDDEPQWGHFRQLACGANDRLHAKCFETSHPEHYHKSQGVARLLIQGAWMCTGWLASADDILITNQHCIENADDALNTDFEFEAEAPECDYSQGQFQTPGVIFAGGQMLKYDAPLDYAIVKVNGNPSSQYPHFEFDPTAQISDGQAFSQAIQDTPIYIPQHSFGYDKELGLVSTHPDDMALGESVCHVLAFDWAACTAFGGYLEVGYYCDTEPGSSGSPVVSSITHQVISLNHCGCNNCACHNIGVPINEIYSEICSDSCTCGAWGCCPDGGDGDSSACGEQPPAPPSSSSCEGHCGTSADGCWCDESCVHYGDCCADVCEYCGIDYKCGEDPVDPTPTDAPEDPVDPSPTDAPGDQCQPNLDTCTDNSDCCSGFCKQKKDGVKICKKPNDDCVEIGEPCSKGNQCCSGNCKKDENGIKVCHAPTVRRRWA